jgi:hypothetical protein
MSAQCHSRLQGECKVQKIDVSIKMMSEALNKNGLHKMQEGLVSYRLTPFLSHLFQSDTTQTR